MEGGDVNNAYLYGNIDVDVIIEQPTDLSGREARPGKVCKLQKSMYGLRQAGNIWGADTLFSWASTQSRIDHRVLFKKVENMFIIVVIIVDHIMFVSNSTQMLNYLKEKLRSKSDVKLFGSLKSLIGWEVKHPKSGVKISQRRYARELLHKY